MIRIIAVLALVIPLAAAAPTKTVHLTIPSGGSISGTGCLISAGAISNCRFESGVELKI